VVGSNEPFAPQAAQRLARTILDSGRTVFSGHALDAMKDDDLSTPDAINTIRAGAYQQARICQRVVAVSDSNSAVTFVIVFRSDTELVVVTG
jgi:hypothetical protein